GISLGGWGCERGGVVCWERVTTCWPSGLNATALTRSACPSKVRSGLPVCESHSRAVLSLEPVRSCLPSGLNFTELIASVCPSKVRSGLPVCVSHRRILLSSKEVTICLPSGLNQPVYPSK